MPTFRQVKSQAWFPRRNFLPYLSCHPYTPGVKCSLSITLIAKFDLRHTHFIFTRQNITVAASHMSKYHAHHIFPGVMSHITILSIFFSRNCSYSFCGQPEYHTCEIIFWRWWKEQWNCKGREEGFLAVVGCDGFFWGDSSSLLSAIGLLRDTLGIVRFVIVCARPCVLRRQSRTPPQRGVMFLVCNEMIWFGCDALLSKYGCCGCTIYGG